MSGLLAGFLGGIAKGGLNIIGEQEQQAREEQQRKAVLGDRIALEREVSGIRVGEQGAIAKTKLDIEEQGRQRQNQAVEGRLDLNAQNAVSPEFIAQKRLDTLAWLRAKREKEGQPTDDAALAPEVDRQVQLAAEREKLAFKRNPRNRAEAAMVEGFADPLALAQADSREEVARVQADSRAQVAQMKVEQARESDVLRHQARMEQLARQQAQSEARQAQSEQKRVSVGWQWTPDGKRQEPVPGGPFDPAVKGDGTRPMPTSAANGLLSNQANLRRAEQALSLLNGEELPGGIKGDQDATGWKNAILPNLVLNRVDPKGVDTRAAIADLGSLTIHDRSGAAVTASEFPRLQPFVPTASDDPATARKKLNQFVQNYRALVDDQTTFFRESGYRVPVENLRSGSVDSGGAPPRITSPDQLRDLPSGSTFTAPDGSIRRKP